MGTESAAREVVFSGMRPTGRLHLGNYWGALRNWVALSRKHPCYFCVVDWHMLASGYEDTSGLRENIREMVLDWLAAGLDPERCVVFKQSCVPEHAELALLLGMVTPLSWLENNPTWKEQLRELAKTKHSQLQGLVTDPALAGQTLFKTRTSPTERAKEPAEARARHEFRTFGHIGYPVLQAADILLYHGARVPVGQDQLPHLELSREIARRFNSIYGPVFTEPQPLLTPTPRLPGVDGRKMSKSYANAVDFYETPESLKSKVMSMYTDPAKIRANDPGHPLPCEENPPGCSVFAFHQVYGEPAFVSQREAECRAGGLGCVACKKDLLLELEPPFAEFRQKRERCAADPNAVERILEEGGRKARAVAQETMREVRRAMRLAS